MAGLLLPLLAGIDERTPMTARFVATLACATLLAAGSTYASPSQAKPGEWTRETRQVGNKVTIDVYRRAPYALTGDASVATPAPSGKCAVETRRVGNKVTLNVYRGC
jgi:hypothetical protein